MVGRNFKILSLLGRVGKFAKLSGIFFFALLGILNSNGCAGFFLESNEEHLKILNLKAGEEEKKVRFMAKSGVTSVAFHPSGSWIATGHEDGGVRIWNPGTGNLLDSIPYQNPEIKYLIFSPDGKFLLAGHSSGGIAVWEFPTPPLKFWELPTPRFKFLLGYPSGFWPWSMDLAWGNPTAAISPDGKMIVTGENDRNNGHIRLWDSLNSDLVRGVESGSNITSVAFSDSGKLIAAVADQKMVKIFNTKTLQLIKSISFEREISTVKFLLDDHLILATKDKILFWSLQEGVESGEFSYGHASTVTSIDLSPDKRFLASGGYDSSVLIWEIATGQILQKITLPDQIITNVNFSPDGKFLAYGGKSIKKDPTLHVISIGIDNNYDSSLQNLKPSTFDANEFPKLMAEIGKTTYKRINIITLLGRQATKKNIISAIESVVSVAKPDDTVVFFYAGQSTLLGETNKRSNFHFLPYDANVASDASILSTGISGDLLSILLNKLEATHQFLLFDTGPSVQTFVETFANEQKEVEPYLKQDIGILANTNPYSPFNDENKSFSSALLEGLKGGAAEGNGRITMQGLGEFVRETLAVGQKPMGNPDYPFYFIMGKDFQIGSISKDSLKTFGKIRENSRTVMVQNRPTILLESQNLKNFKTSEVSIFKKNVSWNFHRAFSPLPESSTGFNHPVQETFPQVDRREETQGEGPREEISKVLGKNYALLFAGDEYDNWDKLPNPINDAETIAKELTMYYGFEEPEIFPNPKKKEILDGLLKYKRKNDYSPNDQLFIFIAGHGHYNADFQEGYLITKDSKFKDFFGESYLSHSLLRKIINSIPVKHIFLVIDACFSGTFDEFIARKRGEPYAEATNYKFIKRKMQFKTRRFLTSGGKEYVPDGRPGMHSPFARKLIEALRGYGGRDGILTLNGILTHVERVDPEPRMGEWGENEPGSDFVFLSTLAKEAL